MARKLLRILTGLVVVLALVFPFLLALERIHESDCFGHLKTGEWMFNNRAIPRAHVFSSTVTGKPWLDWEWLFQAAMYFVNSLGGFTVLVVSKALVVALTGFLTFDTGRRGVRINVPLLAQIKDLNPSTQEEEPEAKAA